MKNVILVWKLVRFSGREDLVLLLRAVEEVKGAERDYSVDVTERALNASNKIQAGKESGCEYSHIEQITIYCRK